jgi:hypothetical protein
MIQLLDKAIEAAVKLSGAKNDPANEFENWRKIFEQSCREQREEILGIFPWMNLQEPLEVHLNSDKAAELKKFWERN